MSRAAAPKVQTWGALPRRDTEARNAGTARFEGMVVVEAKDGNLAVLNRSGPLVEQDAQGRDRERYPIVARPRPPRPEAPHRGARPAPPPARRAPPPPLRRSPVVSGPSPCATTSTGSWYRP